MHRGILGKHIFSTYVYTDYLHAYLIPLHMHAGVLKPCVNLNYSCVHLLLSLTVSARGGALKARVLIVWYSHIVQALGNVGPRKLGST